MEEELKPLRCCSVSGINAEVGSLIDILLVVYRKDCLLTYAGKRDYTALWNVYFKTSTVVPGDSLRRMRSRRGLVGSVLLNFVFLKGEEGSFKKVIDFIVPACFA